MFSPLRNRFGIPGVISVIALVFAMFGGAYAASNDSSPGNATASAKKGPPGPRGKQGKPGKAGATGPAGPAGPQGPAGAKGDKGDNGSAGADGKGAETISFTGSKGPIGGVTCTDGGLEVKSANATTLVCNGKKGTNGTPGPEGPPGPSCNEEGECLLPTGATQTGNWAMSSQGVLEIFTPISYPLSLNENEEPTTHFHYVSTEDGVSPETAAACPGTFQNPEAEPEQLCVYEKFRFNTAAPSALATADETSGLVLQFAPADVEEEADAVGSWAVTTCPEEGCAP
jgi:hypothetical protein